MNKSITKTTTNELLKKNIKFQIVDVRSKEEFIEQHIPDALNIPIEELTSKIQGFSTDTTYIAVCGKGGGRSERAAQLLIDKGFNAYFLEGGTFGWLEDQLRTL